ncbi:winged helix-turn-helix domain-containing tetratricopeptide repeat protein [Bradyrhizobium ivorense]|uniref:winged helix-turn-helix domain-containing tetratricopeptide repeat protein n=1 Tax=Bradyrhizobium ivorense TaxID=2511166 RepID=UPI0010BBDAAA|nr:winged helix-turn-helix domain-containing protein [Bradyrhizobium ivorense]VIO77751.1 Transcriptional regulator HilA [Bradyrhizobium ivorense]
MQVASGKTFGFGKFILDLRRGCLRTDNREVELRPKSFAVLRYLVENAGRLVSKDEIIEAVWSNVTVTDESLTRCVSDIRLALEDADQTVIRTLPRRGYVFDAPVSIGAPDQAPDETVASSPASNLLARKLHGGRFSLVVLPFVNLSGDHTDDHLADAITDGLTTLLSRIRDAFVIARRIAMTYKGKAIDVRQIGQELNVRYVLEGSEQHTGSLVRVSAQLIDVDTGAHLWAERFDTGYVDPLQAQDEIVTRLARALQIELTALASARITPPGAEESHSAEDVALAAEANYLRYGPSRRESELGFQLCERALAIDPNNVRALGILAERTTMRVTGMQSIARDADIRFSEQLVNRALAADPNSYHAHHAKARLLVALGRAEEALIEAERSLRLNPGFIPSYLVLCQANLMLGLPGNAIEHARKVKRLSPPDPYLYVFHVQEGLAHLMLGEDELAVACLRQAVANNPEFPAASGYLTAAYALNGNTADAREQLARYFSLPEAHIKTVAGWRRMGYSQHPAYLALRERIYSGLQRAGMPMT